MASASTLESLPAEVIESIVSRLSFDDICNLRLVSRKLSAKSTHGVTRSHFAAKTIAWTDVGQLQDFVKFTQRGWRGCLVRKLTVAGIAVVPDAEEFGQPLLTEGFTNLKLNSPHGGLDSLTLTVKGANLDTGETVPCSRMRDWRRVWHTAALTFHATSKALAESGLQVKELDVFGDEDRCSLAVDKIGPVLESVNLTTTLQHLTHLALTLSNHITDDAQNTAESSIASSERHISDLLQFLRMCTSLNSLSLRWYNLGPTNDALKVEQDFLQQLVTLEILENLRICCLRGICTDETTLLAFVQKLSQLRDLRLEEIHLLEGDKFGAIFDYLTGESKHLEQLFLDNMWQDRRLVCFNGPGKPHFLSKGNSHKPNDIHWPGRGRRTKIRYSVIQGSPYGSAPHVNWQRKRNLQYGPPSYYGMAAPNWYQC